MREQDSTKRAWVTITYVNDVFFFWIVVYLRQPSRTRSAHAWYDTCAKRARRMCKTCEKQGDSGLCYRRPLTTVFCGTVKHFDCDKMEIRAEYDYNSAKNVWCLILSFTDLTLNIQHMDFDNARARPTTTKLKPWFIFCVLVRSEQGKRLRRSWSVVSLVPTRMI